MSLQYGRRPPKTAPALRFSAFHTGRIPEPPSVPLERLMALAGWELLGNDVAGNGVATAWANDRRLVSATLGGAEFYPTQEQVWELYRTQNPDFDPAGPATGNGPGSAADRGMELQTTLEYIQADDAPDGVRAVAFAQLDTTNMKEVEAAIAIFGSVWLGVLVEQANAAQLRRAQPWCDVAGSPVVGRQVIIGGGRAPDTDVDTPFVGWGQAGALSAAYWAAAPQGQRLVEEAWVVIWPEHLDQAAFDEGVDQTALRTAYRNLTGRTLALPC